MKLYGYLAALLLTAPSVMAEDFMTGEQFEAYTLGKTFEFMVFGQAYGAEQYLPDRRVRWAFNGAPCENGYWYEEAGAICFLYESRNDPQCWYMTMSEDGMVAQFADEGGVVDELYEVEQFEGPLNCPGPNVGV